VGQRGHILRGQGGGASNTGEQREAGKVENRGRMRVPTMWASSSLHSLLRHWLYLCKEGHLGVIENPDCTPLYSIVSPAGLTRQPSFSLNSRLLSGDEELCKGDEDSNP